MPDYRNSDNKRNNHYATACSALRSTFFTWNCRIDSALTVCSADEKEISKMQVAQP